MSSCILHIEILSSPMVICRDFISEGAVKVKEAPEFCTHANMNFVLLRKDRGSCTLIRTQVLGQGHVSG